MSEEKQKLLKQKYLELQLLDHQIKEVQQQQQLLKHHLQELINLQESLSELEKQKEKKSVLAQLGPRTFVKTELIDSKHVLVDVGASIVVEKTIEEAKSFISTQSEELEESTDLINSHVEEAIKQAKKIQNEIIGLQESS